MVGTFPDGESALMLVCARLRYMESSLWGSKLYMSMKHLERQEMEIQLEEGGAQERTAVLGFSPTGGNCVWQV